MEGTATAPDVYRGISDATKLLAALFPETDYVLLRPIETWVQNGKKESRVAYKLITHVRRTEPVLGRALAKLWKNAPELHLNQFFGVCPRYGGYGQYDQAWQIRTVRCIWADIDNITKEEAFERIKAARLPPPSIVVWSGNGVHIYWLLEEPYLIDDVGTPPPVLTEWVQVKGKNKSRKYIVQDDEKLYLDRNRHLTKLSPKALYIQDVLAGVAKAVGGDATHDVSRLLRLPGSLNRKDERNGAPAKECKLIEFHPEREYLLSEFESFKCESPVTKRAREIEAMPLPTVKKRPSVAVTDSINQRIAACGIAEVGMRSETDFALCCLAVRKGVAQNNLWGMVKEVGKFKDEGERYFNRTWANAEYAIKLQKYEELAGKSMWEDEDKPSPAPPEIDSGRRTIEVAASDTPLIDTLQAVTSTLLDSGNCFDRAGKLVAIHDDQINAILTSQELAGLLSQHVEFYFIDERSGKFKPLLPAYGSTWLNNYIERSRLPKILTYVRNPVFNLDWKLVKPGFDKASGIYYAGKEIRPLQGTQHIDALVSEFCFKAAGDRTNYIGILLTTCLMPHFIGTKPAVLFNGNQPGLGKTIMAQLIAILRDGSPAETISYLSNDEEFEKRIGAVVRRGTTTIIIDNAKSGKKIDSPCLERSVTDKILSFRLLGQSATITAENSHIFCITANSPEVSRDLVTRSVVVNLYHEGDPSLRAFKMDDPEGYATAHREQILGELLGMIQRWHDAGSPKAQTHSRFNKSGWGNIIGGILQHARLEGFLANADEAAAQLDQNKREFAELVQYMVGVPTMSWTAGELVVLAEKHKLFADVTSEGSARSKSTKMGTIATANHEANFPLDDGRIAKFMKDDARNGSVYRVFVSEGAEPQA